IPQIDKRTLILWGEADDMLGTDDAERFKRAIAHSQLIWIENCGHVPQFEQPEITAKHILAFR
ncbi:alpha/beta hydrolase, partial [Coleofasciculus sp. FACHB-712]